MKHSFVIPAYKESQYLEDCIKSLKNQTVDSDIVLVSAKNSKFLENLSNKYNIPLFINENGGSIGKDWNFALEKVNTPLVTIAHQDDVYLKSYAQEIIKSFEEDPDSIIAFTDYHEIRNGKVVKDPLNLKIKKILLFPLKLSNNRLSQRCSIMFGNAICCPAVTYNKDRLKDYKFDLSLKSNLDWKAWVDFYKDKEKFNYLPKDLMLHRIHQESETSKQINESNRQNEDVDILKMLWPNWTGKLIEYFYKFSEKSNK